MSILSLSNLTPVSIPDPTTPEYITFKTNLLNSATSLIHSLPPAAASSTKSSKPTWRKGSTYNKSAIPTVSHRAASPPGAGKTNGFKWHARISHHAPSAAASISQEEGHAESLWERFEEGLGRDHSLNEKEYIESCESAKLLHVYEKGVLEVWQMSYKLPAPTTNRDFVILLFTPPYIPPTADSIAPAARSFLVVSIPFQHPDAPARKNYVRGRYVSVEEVVEEEEKEGARGVVWKMATASDAGGAVPKFITELAMPSKVAEDVPSFVDWLARKKI